jgi:hypothetical protein
VSGPRNAVTDANGFRRYTWSPTPESQEWLWNNKLPVDAQVVMSVTSIRKALGEGFNLVNWKVANVADAATGMQKREVIGPRGGVSTKRVKVEFPPPFITMMLETEGDQKKLEKVRVWLRDAADEPRNIAAVRGTLVHEAIERGATLEEIDLDYMHAAVLRLDDKDQKKIKHVETQDLLFVQSCVKQYWDMRRKRPFVILAREPQVWNLTAGYSGSTDALLWTPPVGQSFANPRQLEAWQELADAGLLTQELIAKIGGPVVLGDWKTGKGIYIDQVIQCTAYLTAEFVGADGVIDLRLTEIIRAARKAALVHIRPNGWAIHRFDFRQDVLYAFLGSVAYARFIMTHPDPWAIFTDTERGEAA